MRPSRPALLAVAVVITTMSAALPLLASRQGPASTDTPPARQALNVDFPGGTGAEYIAAICKADADANIVVLGELERITMPAVRLRDVDVASALGVLNSLQLQQDTQVTSVNIKEILHHGERSPVFTITAYVRDPDKRRSGTQETTVISMADLLGEHLKPADALKAIETALELVKGEYDPAQIKFHEETGLLIARGSPEQIASIQQVITQLRQRAETLQRKEEQASQEARGESRTREAEQARADKERLQIQVTEAETRARLLQQEVAKLREVVSRLEDEMRKVNAERDALARQAAESKPKTGG